ncbi:MAG: winged helix-turn-helix transcriptional regulator [Saprospiraceae bacterium]|nr:winged helix-turn-helix transcriptional regulator [Saprospiraceae bacterium]MCB0542229.1 winged helix-turn-helix transcriptional regulator [Saprospiraceae bacterium]MCB0575373.1 winged helix-turn-helix transcriptional regulator [Saprospiraceae bacterium]MCB9355106.1 winged helix-turn-helix transcriptional regulator [Lewinellaceae bacterium]
MAVNKKHAFAESDVALAEFAKALSHPARVAILRTLAEKKVCICGEIVEVLPLAQATVSQHLKELKNAGLITGEIEGVRSCYCIHWEHFESMLERLEQFGASLRALKPNSDCC